MKLFCIIGEESGDVHGGQVLRLLKKEIPELEIVGTGGKNFREVSSKNFARAEDMAVIGFWEVLKRRKYYVGLIETLAETVKKEKPDFLFLVDYPGLNLRLAKRVREKVPKIIYYISPQVWAWKSKRAFQMKELIDLLIVLFPFETKFLKNFAGMKSLCFGHPVLDIYRKVSKTPLPFVKEKKKTYVAVLPGSRLSEIHRFLPVLCKAIQIANKQMPDLQFSIICAGTIPREEFMRYGCDSIPQVPLITENRKSYIYHSDFAWCCSGTASLECAALKTPPLIFYQSSLFTELLYRLLVKTPYLGMPNILLQREAFPEIYQRGFNPQNLIRTTRKMLKNPEYKNGGEALFQKLHETLGQENAYESTAKHLVEYIRETGKKKPLRKKN